MTSLSPEEQDERRSRLLDAMPAIAWSASARTFRFTYVNPAAEKLLGYPVERWLQDPHFWIEHLHPEDRNVARFCHNETLAARDHELEYRMIAADGRTVWLRDYVNVHCVDGIPVELFGVMVDITRERKVEAAWLESRENFRRMVELSPDCIGVHVDGTYVYVNQAFVQLLGAQNETEIVGRSVISCIDPACRGDARAQLAEVAAGRSAPYRRERYIRIDGSLVDVETAALPLRYGNSDAVQMIVRDITDRIRAEEESQARARKLEEAKRMSSLGQVAASLAHEFNNVLMGIQPFVEVIARHAPPTQTVGDALGHIHRSVSRGKRASQEILRFANPKEPQLFPIDMRIWLPTLLGQLVASLPSSITLDSSIAPGVSFVRGDAAHLEQVLTNLVFNARDAIGSNGAIHVAVSASETGVVRIAVSDDGCGIAPAVLDRIFEPLFTTKRNGTGLGLAIARRLMERQGGALTAQNRPEGGSVFHVSIPAAEDCAAVVVPAESTPSGVTRLLLVEDDDSVGSGLEALLSSEGYETTWVRAAAEVCDAARRMRPQVAIIDVNLPDGNGVDLVPLLRAEHHDLPIILSTGHVEMNVAGESKRILALLKPYELNDLLAAITNVVN